MLKNEENSETTMIIKQDEKKLGKSYRLCREKFSPFFYSSTVSLKKSVKISNFLSPFVSSKLNNLIIQIRTNFRHKKHPLMKALAMVKHEKNIKKRVQSKFTEKTPKINYLCDLQPENSNSAIDQ